MQPQVKTFIAVKGAGQTRSGLNARLEDDINALSRR